MSLTNQFASSRDFEAGPALQHLVQTSQSSSISFEKKERERRLIGSRLECMQANDKKLGEGK